MPTPTFGIEIEFVCATHTQAQVAAAISTAGVPCYAAGYTHQQNSTWKVVSDASVAGGHEVVSPILSGLDDVDRVCAALASIGARVNRQCGLHIHVGARHLQVTAMKRLAALYAECEGVIDTLLPPSRRANNNAYARTLQGLSAPTLAQATEATSIANAVSGGQRFSKLNFTAFWRHGTVEFRQHSGTIDPAKIKNWALLCLKLVATAEREQDAWSAAAAVAAPAAAQPNMATNPYWRRGRRARVVWSMISRPEGATAEEIRAAMGLRARPGIPWHINNAREYGPVEFYTTHSIRRGGKVFHLRHGSTAPQPAAPQQPRLSPVTSLDAFLDKVGVVGVERTYWIERAAMLSAAHE